MKFSITLTEEEIATASHELAKETCDDLFDLADRMEDMDFANRVQMAYADFMLPFHRKMVNCS